MNTLIEKLRALLVQYFSTCPVCGTSCTWDESLLTHLLADGEMWIACACKGRSWPREERPLLVQELHDLYCLMKVLPSDLDKPDVYDPWYEIVRVEVNGVRVFYLAIDYISDCVCAFLDRAALEAMSCDPVVRFVWTERKAAALALQTTQREDEVRNGRVFKLRLRWNAPMRQWEHHSRRDEGNLTFIVHRDSVQNVTEEGWYYCRPVTANPPPHQPGVARNIGVRPVTKIPARYQPTDGRPVPFFWPPRT